MTAGAHVGSLEAVRDFRAALCVFANEAREATCSYELEVRRALEWLLEDRPRYWQHALRASEEAVVQAKIELERRRHEKLPGGEPASCIEERRALERARRRQAHVERMLETVRKWSHIAQRETTEFLGRSHQLAGHLEVELPQAIAELDRVLQVLESYIAIKPEGVRSRDPDPLVPATAARAQNSADPPRTPDAETPRNKSTADDAIPQRAAKP